MKKYELTDNVTLVNDRLENERRFYQVRAVRDIQGNGNLHVPAGTLGGWIESEKNFSQEGNCWLDKDSYLFNDSYLGDEAYLEGSELYDEAIVEGNAVVINSVVCDKAIISGDAFLDDSYIYLDSFIKGHHKVIDSELYNVQIKNPSKNGVNKAVTCHFKHVFLKSESYLVEFEANCDWNNVHMWGRKLKFNGETTLENVNAENLKVFQIFASMRMENTTIIEDTVFSVPHNSAQVVITGSNHSNESGIVIQSKGIRLTNTRINGDVHISGRWTFNNTSLSDFAVLKNESDVKHRLVDSSLCDFSKVTCKEKYEGNAVDEVVKLSMEDEYRIR